MTNKINTTVDEMHVGKIAEILGVTDRRVRQIAADIGLAPVRRGVFELGPIFRHELRRLEKAKNEPSTNPYREARATEIEERTAARRAKLIPIQDFDAVTVNLLQIVREECERAYSKSDLPSNIKEKLRNELERILGKAERLKDALGQALKDGKDPAEVVVSS